MVELEFTQKIPALLHTTSQVLASWLDRALPAIAPDLWWKTLVLQPLSSSQTRRIHERGLTTLDQLDLAALLRVLDSNWYSLSQALRLDTEQRHYAKEMFTIRNRWAHLSANTELDADDVYRDVDTLQRFLDTLGADASILDEVKALKSKIHAGTTPARSGNQPPKEDARLEAAPTHVIVLLAVGERNSLILK